MRAIPLIAILTTAVLAVCGKPLRPEEPAGDGDHLIRGRVLDAETGEPDGTLGIRVPRARLQVMTVNHRMAPDPPEIDLTGVTGATHAADIPFR